MVNTSCFYISFQRMLRFQVISLSIYLKTLSSITTHSVVNPNTHPPNVVVPVSHPATFPLTYSPCNWDRNVNNDLVPIYRPSDNVSVSSAYSLNLTVPGQCDLTIKNVTFFDAGLYQYENGDAYGFELFVIDEKPVCFVEPDETETSGNKNVTLGCSLSLSHRDKNLAPVLRWQLMLTEHDKSLRSGKETKVRGADHDTVTSLVTVPNGNPINHVVCFTQLGGLPASASDDKVAQNRISFDGHCQIGHIEIPAKNIRILNDMNMKIGEKIVCTADGYPEVKYHWTRDGVPIHEGPDVMLDTEGLHKYRCFAYNNIQGQNHSTSVESLILVKEGNENKNVTKLMLSSLERLDAQNREILDEQKLKKNEQIWAWVLSILAFVLSILCISIILYFLLLLYRKTSQPSLQVEEPDAEEFFLSSNDDETHLKTTQLRIQHGTVRLFNLLFKWKRQMQKKGH